MFRYMFYYYYFYNNTNEINYTMIERVENAEYSEIY